MEIITLTLNKKIGERKIDELIQKLKGDDKNMMAVEEMIIEENRMLREQGKIEGKREGKRETKLEIAKRLKEKNVDLSIIMYVTNLSRKR